MTIEIRDMWTAIMVGLGLCAGWLIGDVIVLLARRLYEGVRNRRRMYRAVSEQEHSPVDLSADGWGR